MKLAYLGASYGGQIAPALLAVESRFKAAILSSGGLMLRHDPPEVHRLNFVTRVKTPVLMLKRPVRCRFSARVVPASVFHLLGTPTRTRSTWSTKLGTATCRIVRKSVRPSIGSTSIWGQSSTAALSFEKRDQRELNAMLLKTAVARFLPFGCNGKTNQAARATQGEGRKSADASRDEARSGNVHPRKWRLNVSFSAG